MKILFLYLFVFAQTAFSMQSAETELNNDSAVEKCQKQLGEIIPLSRLLPNFETYAFIDSIKPGEVLFSTTTEAALNASHLFKDFFVVCYQAERYGDAYYFVPETMTEDAEKSLSLYGEKSTGFYAYLIPVKDVLKFWELASKTTPGCANKDGAWKNDFSRRNHDWERLEHEGYQLLNKDRIRFAKNAPSQDSNPRNASWSCGPNSGFRALRLLDEKIDNYESFVENCPRTINSNVVGIIASVFFTPIIGGLISQTDCDVGPSPEPLAAYLTRSMKAHSAYFMGLDPSYGSITTPIVHHILCGNPMIILLVSGTFNMHYVTIIGTKKDRYNPLSTDSVVILDTSGEIGLLSAAKLQHWMNRDGYASGLLPAQYNTVAFTDK